MAAPGQSKYADGVVAEIRRRQQRGQPDRVIARELSVDRETARAIGRGELAENGPCYERCSGCGHKVLLPCRICQARAMLA